MTDNRGRALIINNVVFQDRPNLERKGSEKDVQTMNELLQCLCFDVNVKQNLTAMVSS